MDEVSYKFKLFYFFFKRHFKEFNLIYDTIIVSQLKDKLKKIVIEWLDGMI